MRLILTGESAGELANPKRKTHKPSYCFRRTIVEGKLSWLWPVRMQRIVYTSCYDSTVIISGFDWDDENIFHIARHQFTPEEVEESFCGRLQGQTWAVRNSISRWERLSMADWPLSYFGACTEA